MKKDLLKKIGSKFLKISIIALLIYMAIVGYMYYTQDSYVFFPQPISEQTIERIKNDYKNVEELSIKTVDNNVLNGWLIKNSKTEKAPLLIHFGGNAEEVSHLIEECSHIDGWSVALFNYRGYGASTGKPREAQLFSDSILIYDNLCQRNDIDKNNIVVFGRSLGSGIAVNLAVNRNVKGAILATPYDSIANIAKEQYPYLPIDIIMRNKFDSLSRVPSIKAPILVLAAENDQVVKRNHTLKLLENLKGNYKFITIEKTDHENIYSNDLYWKYIKEFLEGIK